MPLAMVLKTFWASPELPLLLLHIHRSQADPLVESSRCLRFRERLFGLLEVDIDWYDPFWLVLWRSGLVCNGWQLLYKIVSVVGTQVKTDPVGLIMVKIPGVPQLQFLSKGQNIHLLASKCKLLSGLWGSPTSMALKSTLAYIYVTLSNLFSLSEP